MGRKGRSGGGVSSQQTMPSAPPAQSAASTDSSSQPAEPPSKAADGATRVATASQQPADAAREAGGFSLAFEICFMLALFSMIVLQNFNMHRLQFEKYNVPHIAFTGLLFTARITWKQIIPVLGGNRRVTFGDVVRFGIFLLLSYALARSVRELFTKHSAQTVMYLGLPILLYVSAFGAVLDSGVRWYFGRFAGSPRQHGDFFADVIARILYGSLEAAYYTAALPMRFLADSNMVYDKTTNIVVVVLLFFVTLCLLTTNLMSTSWKQLYAQADDLGYWTESKKQHGAAATWSPSVWTAGSVCKHRKKIYIAGSRTSVEPGDIMTDLFHRVFHSPLSTLNAIIFGNMIILAIEVVLIIAAQRWNVICWFTMFAFSFLTLVYAASVRRAVIRAVEAREIALETRKEYGNQQRGKRN